MEADTTVAEKPRPCCAKWRDKYTKVRNDVSTTLQDALKLTKAYEKEKQARAASEKEILNLKSQITLLEQNRNGDNQEHARVSELEGEVCELSNLMEEVMEKSEFEKKTIEDALMKLVNQEKKKAQELVMKHSGLEAEIVRLKGENRSVNEILVKERRSGSASQAEASELRAKFAAERKNMEDARTRLETEKKMAELEKARFEEHRKFVEEERKKVMEEKARCQKLEEANTAKENAELEIAKFAEQKKFAEEEEKKQYSVLCKKLEEARKINEELKKEIDAAKMKGATCAMSNVTTDSDGDIELLEKHLKLERMQVKHYKKVANFENKWRRLLEQELSRFKQDFFQLANRLNMLDGSFYKGIEGVDASTLIQASNENNRFIGKEAFSLYDKSENEVVKSYFDHFRSSVESNAPTKPISGMSLDCMIGDSLRNKLQSSAIYTSNTSFSDGPSSVGSQENDIYTDSIPESLRQGAIISGMCADSTRPTVDANQKSRSLTLSKLDNITAVDRAVGLKRKAFQDEVESLKCLPSKLPNLPTQIEGNLVPVNDESVMRRNVRPETICSQIVRNASGPVDESCPDAPLLNHEHAMNYISIKKRKVSLNQKHILESASIKDFSEMTDTASHDTWPLGSSQPCRDEAIVNEEAEVPFDKMTHEDIMRLLELDDPDDEARFRMAMENPLSPTVPEIMIPSAEPLLVDDFIISIEGTCNSHGTRFHQSENYECTIEESQKEDAGYHNTEATKSNSPFQVSKESSKMEMAKQLSGNEMMEVHDTNSEEHKNGIVSKCFVLFPNMKDESSLSRMICAHETCISECSRVSEKGWVIDKFVIALAKEGGLLADEKACVFFSLLLNNLLSTTSVNCRDSSIEDVYLESFWTHMKAVMAAVGTRSILLDQIKLDTLFALMETFLTDKRVMLYKNVSNQSQPQRDAQSIGFLDGTSIPISCEPATTDHLVAGASLLASICAITGDIGFICDTSYKLLRTHRSDPNLMLTVVHSFASVCGSKYFNMKGHNLSMTVISCIVALLEEGNVAIDATCGSSFQYQNETLQRFSPCAECVFSKSVVSLDEVFSSLMEKIQEHALTKMGYQPNSDISDILSLIELLASYTSWEWTRSKVIPQLLKTVESCVPEEFSVAVILLIGQVGRFEFGGGCEQLGLEELRCSLAALLNRRTTRGWGLRAQLATVHSLIGLISVNFGEILKGEALQADAGQNVLPNIIRSWFSQLSEEQKNLSLSILQPTSSHGN